MLFYFGQFLRVDVSARRTFASCSVQCHLLSIFCTFVIEQINNDDDDDDVWTLYMPLLLCSLFTGLHRD